MTRSEYVERVLSVMKHVTGEEREAIRAEIDAHIEDHICGLLELDYDEALAEERTMALMGDPEEVGRELDKQYPAVWLILKRLAIVLTVVMLLLVRYDLRVILENTGDSLRARYFPETVMTVDKYRDPMEVVEKTDFRAESNGITMRVYQVGLVDADAEYSQAYLAVSAWGHDSFEENWPGDSYAVFMANSLEVTSTSGKTATQDWGNRWCHVYTVLASYGDQVVLTYDRYGQQFELTVDLPWKERDA